MAYSRGNFSPNVTFEIGDLDTLHNQNSGQSLFRALRRLIFDPTEKPDIPENLTDILEIVAVELSSKPSHLNGQGFRSDRLMGQLEDVCSQFGLRTMRTRPIRPFLHRFPNYERKIVDWETEKEELERLSGPDVLWIYKDAEIPARIQDAVAGKTDTARALGYPGCCVRYHGETGIHMGEVYVQSLKKKFHTTSAEDVLKLMEDDVEVEIVGEEIDLTTAKTSKRFPYIQFSACPSCLESSGSPAEEVNMAMRHLGFSLSEQFGREIWRAQYQLLEAQGEKIKIGRNSPCPCGSGAKYKKCCGQS